MKKTIHALIGMLLLVELVKGRIHQENNDNNDSDKAVSGSFFLGRLFVDECREQESGEYKTVRVFSLWAFLKRRLGLGHDMRGSCAELCSGLCGAQCLAITSDDASCSCQCNISSPSPSPSLSVTNPLPSSTPVTVSTSTITTASPTVLSSSTPPAISATHMTSLTETLISTSKTTTASPSNPIESLQPLIPTESCSEVCQRLSSCDLQEEGHCQDQCMLSWDKEYFDDDILRCMLEKTKSTESCEEFRQGVRQCQGFTEPKREPASFFSCADDIDGCIFDKNAIKEDVHEAIPRIEHYFTNAFGGYHCSIQLVPAVGDSAYDLQLVNGLVEGDDHDTEGRYFFQAGWCGSNIPGVTGGTKIDLSAFRDEPKPCVDVGSDEFTVCSSDRRCDGKNVFDAITDGDELGMCLGYCSGTDQIACVVGNPGGICSQITLAHQLVDSGYVDVNWPCVTELNYAGNSVWDPKFLKAIHDASGDSDNDLALSTDQVTKAIEAEWKLDKQITLTRYEKLGSNLLTNYMIPQVVAVELFCTILENMLKGNSCHLAAWQKDSSSQLVNGHLAPIVAAEYNAETETKKAHCSVIVKDTFVQGSYGSFEGTLLDAKEEVWLVYGDETIIPTDLGPTGPGKAAYDYFEYSCIDKVDPMQGNPGQAMPLCSSETPSPTPSSTQAPTTIPPTTKSPTTIPPTTIDIAPILLCEAEGYFRECRSTCDGLPGGTGHGCPIGEVCCPTCAIISDGLCAETCPENLSTMAKGMLGCPADLHCCWSVDIQ